MLVNVFVFETFNFVIFNAMKFFKTIFYVIAYSIEDKVKQELNCDLSRRRKSIQPMTSLKIYTKYSGVKIFLKRMKTH